MRHTLQACLLGLFTLFTTAALAAQAPIQASDAIARAMPKVAPTSAVFLTLHNASDKDRALVAARSSAARAVELHTHTMTDGVMSMRRVERIELPAGEKVVFQPGGLHIMLIGLNHALEDGQQIDLTLEFADGQTMELKVPVGQPGMGHHQHHMH